MSLSPAKAQAKVLRLQRRAARVLHLLPRVGLCFTGDYSGLGAAFRTEGWSKEAVSQPELGTDRIVRFVTKQAPAPQA